jgi:THAP domain
MGRTCYVVGCKSGYEGVKEKDRTVHFFSARNPKTLSLWRAIIPRKDLKLESKHYVCEKHFREEDIMKQKQ